MSRVHFDSRHNQVVSEIRGGTNAVLAGQSSSTNTVVSEMRAMEERLKLCLPTGETNMQTAEDGPMETADEETHQMPTGETNMLCIEDVPMETADEETHQTETIDEAGYIAQSEDVSMESAEAPEKMKSHTSRRVSAWIRRSLSRKMGSHASRSHTSRRWRAWSRRSLSRKMRNHATS